MVDESKALRSGESKSSGQTDDERFMELVQSRPRLALRALQNLAEKALAAAIKKKNDAEKAEREGMGTPASSALAQSAHHMRDSVAALGRVEGGLNQASQALEHAQIHADRSTAALEKKVTS